MPPIDDIITNESEDSESPTAEPTVDTYPETEGGEASEPEASDLSEESEVSEVTPEPEVIAEEPPGLTEADFSGAAEFTALAEKRRAGLVLNKASLQEQILDLQNQLAGVESSLAELPFEIAQAQAVLGNAVSPQRRVRSWDFGHEAVIAVYTSAGPIVEFVESTQITLGASAAKPSDAEA